MAIPTVKVTHKKHGLLVINEKDFDPRVHTKVVDEEPEKGAGAGKKTDKKPE